MADFISKSAILQVSSRASVVDGERRMCGSKTCVGLVIATAPFGTIN